MRPIAKLTTIALAVLAIAAAVFATQRLAGFDGASAEEALAGEESMKAPLLAPHMVSLAADLAALGRERKDALYLLAAARLLDESKAKASTQSPTVSGGNPNDPVPPLPGQAHSSSALLDEARSLAGDNPALLALVVQSRPKTEGNLDTKGTAAGHHDFATWLRPGAAATYYADFRAREPAEAMVWGDGSGDLDLVVYGADHRVICVSRNYGDREWCRWIPRENERFALVVESHSPRWNFYSIFTN